ncbi:hypothetical protein LCGC14_1932340 [marine sediment metagenome]|uniref:Uncharacterized protein n=1 Tax=marine sediment metagenome TaxID=412755 RepID=A0A0F9I1F6_9ZZZZ|nr:B12-binding domain-containing radical SAM protein [Spirochaetota bacterium]
MKVLLISPCKDPERKRPKFLMMPQLSLHILEGLTPPEHEVKIVEEEIEDINLDEDCDLVGISCMTANAPRAYYLAKEFKKRGKKIVLGGVHPTILPDEALRHADSVVIGEVEGIWPELLEDVKNGGLKKKYKKPYPSLDEYIKIKHRKDTKKRLFNVIPVMTTRGCPFNCDFCCVHDIYGPKIRHYPIENVVRDIMDAEGKFFLFLDDNIMGDTRYAKKLFSAIKPLKIKWIGQASITFVKDIELISLAAASGCTGLFFGLETVSKSQLLKLRKSIKDIKKIEEAIKKIESYGIFFHPSMIFGFDDDTKDVFPETLDFLDKNKISSVSLNTLTPYPGTKTYRKLKEERRLITDDWKYFDHKSVVFKPKNMSPFELQAGRLWVFKEFTKFSSMLKKLPFHLDHPFYHLAMGIGHKKVFKNEFKDFPRLASHLFPLSDNLEAHYEYFSILALSLADFIPRNDYIGGNKV